MNKELKNLLLLSVMFSLGAEFCYAAPSNIKEAVNDNITTSYTLIENEILTSNIGSMGSCKTEMLINSSGENNFTVNGYNSVDDTHYSGITIGNGQTMTVDNINFQNLESEADGGALF